MERRAILIILDMELGEVVSIDMIDADDPRKEAEDLFDAANVYGEYNTPRYQRRIIMDTATSRYCANRAVDRIGQQAEE